MKKKNSKWKDIKYIIWKIVVLSAVFSTLIYRPGLYGQNIRTDKYVIPQIGDTVKEHMFTDLINYSKKSIKISDYRGRWLVLDWWTIGCAGCIASMPKVDKMAKDFKTNADFMMIGLYEKNKVRTQSVYAKLIKKYGLSLTASFDSTSLHVYGIQAVPFILVINPEGIIKAKTFSLDSATLSKIISGQDVELYSYAYSVGENQKLETYTSKIPFLTNGGKMSNGGVDTSFIYRSVLARWTPLVQGGALGFMDNESTYNKIAKKGEAQTLKESLANMIRIAVVGKNGWGYEDTAIYNNYYYPLILEIPDSSRFLPANSRTSENYYSYSIKTPGFSESRIRALMLRELEEVFNFKLNIELRKVPGYKLVISDYKKLVKAKTRYIRFDSKFPDDRMDIRCISVNKLVGFLGGTVASLDGSTSYPLLKDDTNSDLKIDVNLTLDYFDIGLVYKELDRYGLKIVKDLFPMHCLVIKERKY